MSADLPGFPKAQVSKEVSAEAEITKSVTEDQQTVTNTGRREARITSSSLVRKELVRTEVRTEQIATERALPSRSKVANPADRSSKQG